MTTEELRASVPAPHSRNTWQKSKGKIIIFFHENEECQSNPGTTHDCTQRRA